MKKVFNFIKKHILITTIISTFIFVLLHFLLGLCDIMFRQWIYYLVGILIVIALIAGMIQTIKKTQNKIIKIIIKIISIIIVICTILSSYIIMLFLVFSYSPEHVIEKNGKKYVAYVKSFTHVNVYYYDYINFFLVGNKVKIEEYYGRGGYDPFDGEYDYKEPTYYCYDDNGNVIDTNTDYYKYHNSNNKSEISDDNNNKYDESNQNNNIYWIDNNIAYKVDIVDCAMGSEGIKIYRTDNAGESWKSQLTSDYGILSVHYNSEFSFLKDNLAFIYDPGRAGVETEKGKLMVSTNNSKTYIPCIIELPRTFDTTTIYIDGLPTYENNELKLKVYSINYQNNSTKTYYDYTSEDGITWLYKRD